MRALFALVATLCAGDFVRNIYNTSDCSGRIIEFDWVTDSAPCSSSTACTPDFQYGGLGTKTVCTKGGPVAAPSGFVTFSTYQFQPTCSGTPFSRRGLALNTCHVFESENGAEASRYTCDGSTLTLRLFEGVTSCSGQYFTIKNSVNCSVPASSDSAVLTACS